MVHNEYRRKIKTENTGWRSPLVLVVVVVVTRMLSLLVSPRLPLPMASPGGKSFFFFSLSKDFSFARDLVKECWCQAQTDGEKS